MSEDRRNAPTALEVAHAGAGQADSPEHKRFRRLLRDIDAARQRLADWQRQLPLFAAAYEDKVAPSEQMLGAFRRRWAFELEQLLLERKWSRAERQTLARMICDLAAAELDDDAPDPELLALHDRHAELDHAGQMQQEVEDMKDMLGHITGLDASQAEARTPEDLLEWARLRMAEQAARPPGAASGNGPDPAQAWPQPRRPRKATKAEQRAAEDARMATQSVRDVYRKLAAALHPDRAAPDTTPAQQALRHERMARANAAYEAGDLLALLTLQLEIEQVDMAHAAHIAAGQVRHFNRVLAEQLRKIEADVHEREMAFCASYGLMPFSRPNPNRLAGFIKQAVADTDEAIDRLHAERRVLRGDPAGVRRYLKQQAHLHRMEDDGVSDFF